MEVPRWGAGSALVAKGPTHTTALVQKYPEVIVVGNNRYTFVKEDTNGIVHFIGQDAAAITGRRFKYPVSRSNGTLIAAQ